MRDMICFFAFIPQPNTSMILGIFQIPRISLLHWVSCIKFLCFRTMSLTDTDTDTRTQSMKPMLRLRFECLQLYMLLACHGRRRPRSLRSPDGLENSINERNQVSFLSARKIREPELRTPSTSGGVLRLTTYKNYWSSSRIGSSRQGWNKRAE